MCPFNVIAYTQCTRVSKAVLAEETISKGFIDLFRFENIQFAK